MRKIHFAPFFAALVAAFLGGCASAPAPGGLRGEPLLIAAIGPLTGDAAVFGDQARRGYELAVEEANASGGVGGRPIKLLHLDDRSDPSSGLAEIQRAVYGSKPVAILGAVMSSVSLPVAAVAQSYSIPMVSPTSTNPRVTQTGDFIFRACFIDPYQGRLAAAFASRDLGKTKAAVLFDRSNDYSSVMASVFREGFEARGGRVLAFEGHDPGTQDFSEYLTRIVAARPELLFIPDYYFDAALVAKQARDLGFEGVLLGGDGWDSPDLAAKAGQAIEGAYFVNHWDLGAEGAAYSRFLAAYKAKYGEDPMIIAPLGYDAAWLLIDAMRRAGSTDGRAIRDALAKTDLELLTGHYAFDADRNPVKEGVIVTIKDGQAEYFATVAP